jgi:hypothetical protein
MLAKVLPVLILCSGIDLLEDEDPDAEVRLSYAGLLHF